MNKEFKRMQQLAGLVVESLNFDGNAELEKIVPEKADYVRDEVNTLISENGAQMYDGLLAVVDELANDDNWWNARYREIKDEWEKRQLDNWKSSFEHYTWALNNGLAKECARAILPLGTSTTMYMSGTIRSWIHYVELRSANGTQKEHMDIAEKCKDIIKRELPTIAKAVGW